MSDSDSDGDGDGDGNGDGDGDGDGAAAFDATTLPSADFAADSTSGGAGRGSAAGAPGSASLEPCAADDNCVIRLRAAEAQRVLGAGAGAWTPEQKARKAGCLHVDAVSNAGSVGGGGGGGADGLVRASRSASGAISADELALRKRQSIEQVARLTAAINKMPRRMSDSAWALREMGLASSALSLRRLTAEDIDKLVTSKALKHKDGYDVTAAAAKMGILIFPAEASALRECLELRDAAHEQVTGHGYKRLQKALQEPAEPVTVPPVAPASVVPPVSTVGSRAQPGALGAPCEGSVRPVLPPASSSSAAASAALALAGLHKRGRKSSTTRCAAVQDGKTCNGRANRYGNLLCDRHRKQLVRGRGAMMEAANDVLRAEALANYKPKKRRRRSKKK